MKKIISFCGAAFYLFSFSEVQLREDEEKKDLQIEKSDKELFDDFLSAYLDQEYKGIIYDEKLKKSFDKFIYRIQNGKLDIEGKTNIQWKYFIRAIKNPNSFGFYRYFCLNKDRQSNFALSDFNKTLRLLKKTTLQCSEWKEKDPLGYFIAQHYKKQEQNISKSDSDVDFDDIIVFDKKNLSEEHRIQRKQVVESFKNPIVNSENWRILYNQDDYLETRDKSIELNDYYIKNIYKPFKETHRGSLQKGGYISKVGYFAYLPPKNIPIKTVLFQIYGGLNTIWNPSALEDIHKQNLLSQGIAVIDLYLPDMTELKIFQSQMPKDLFLKIQSKVHEAYEFFLKKNKKYFGTEKEISSFLFGHSFGGMMTTRHAELYPNTFTGYISYDGELVSAHHSPSVRDLDRLSHRVNLKHLRPIDFVEKLNDPLLVIQNYNDGNIGLTNVTDFFKAAKEKHKTNLLDLYVFTKSISNVGHTIPKLETDPWYSVEFLDVLVKYMLDKSNPLNRENSPRSQAITQRRAFRYEILSADISREKNFTEVFLAAAFKVYLQKRYGEKKEKIPEGTPTVSDDLWNKEILPILFEMIAGEIINGHPFTKIYPNEGTPLTVQDGYPKELTHLVRLDNVAVNQWIEGQAEILHNKFSKEHSLTKEAFSENLKSMTDEILGVCSSSEKESELCIAYTPPTLDYQPTLVEILRQLIQGSDKIKGALKDHEAIKKLREKLNDVIKEDNKNVLLTLKLLDPKEVIKAARKINQNNK